MERYEGLLRFVAAVSGEEDPRPEMVSGDASFRKSYRFRELIYVDAPPATEKNREFVYLSEVYNRSGVHVPRILAADLLNGYLCVEDLGRLMFSEAAAGDRLEDMYRRAVDLLPSLARISGSFQPFDREFVLRELQIFLDWYLGARLGRTLDPAERQIWDQAADLMAATCAAQPQITMHRDFHSRNIMVTDDGSLALVDFQDTVTGPLTYDLVSLVKDCYVTLEPAFREELTERAREAFLREGIICGISREEFARWVDLTGMQRHLKAAGIFCRLLHRDGRDGYLRYLPRTCGYIREVAGRVPELGDFAALMEDILQ